MVSFTFGSQRACSWASVTWCFVLLSGLCCCHGLLHQGTVNLVDRLQSVSESSPIPDNTKQQDTAVVDLAALLDAGDGAVVTLVAGNTRLAAHRAVLAARSPVLAAMLRPGTLEVDFPGLEGPVLRQLVAFLYSGRAPRLPGLALQLLAAAEKYGVPALKEFYEQYLQEVARQLSVENAAATAVLAQRYGSHSLRQAAVAFIRDHMRVLSTQGWADAVRDHPSEMVQITRLLIGLPVETSAATTTDSRPIPTATPIGNPVAADSTSTPTAASPADVPTTATTTLATTDSTSTSTAAIPTAPKGCQFSQPPDPTAVSFFRSLSAEVRDRRLILAAYEGAMQKVRALLAAKADVGARDGEGVTALHHAAYRGHLEVVQCLLQAGADVDSRTTGPQATPLHLASVHSDVAVVRLLLASHADVGARDRDGQTPLHWAAFWGNAEAAAALLEAGADRGARDDYGDTPLDLARRQDLRRMLQ